MILHQVESLAAAGVTDIVLAVNYRPDVMVSALKKVRLSFTEKLESPILMSIANSMKNNTMCGSSSPSNPNH
jgi:NDP-sugar pyrophosphorylase family protein